MSILSSTPILSLVSELDKKICISVFLYTNAPMWKMFKIFSENDTSRGKNIGESEFDIFEVKKTLPWFRKGVLCIEAKIRENRIFA